jgi:DNA-binding NarL/FixJ family response regulator
VSTGHRHPMPSLTTPAQRTAWRRNAARGRAVYSEIAAERRERFAELIRGGYTIQQAAWELRISRRTADRYVARIRADNTAHYTPKGT